MKIPSKPQTVSALRIGFVGLSDAAPLVAAKEKGFFAKEGLQVQLSREVGWVTVREKMLTRELEAAQAPAPMLWASRLGMGGVAFPACTALVLSMHGNAICLSNRLRVWGVHNPASLRIEALRRRGERKLVFGVVYPYSTHNLHLRSWLKSAGLVPDRDVRIATVPPAQMLPTMAAGTIDGFMAGEPWTSQAVALNEGWCPAWSGALFPGHVEKVLMVRDEFAESPRHAALVRAISAAGAWCDEPHHREELATLLSQPRYLNLKKEVLLPALVGPFNYGQGKSERLPDFLIFHQGKAQVPLPSRALALQRDLVAAELLPSQLPDKLPETLFREDLHHGALSATETISLGHG